jgi:hypothetical protein
MRRPLLRLIRRPSRAFSGRYVRGETGQLMSLDYLKRTRIAVDRPRSKGWGRFIAPIAFICAGVVPMGVLLIRTEQAANAERDAFWVIGHNACQQISASKFHSVSSLPKITPYSGATFGRYRGDVTCARKLEERSRERSTICKFSAPDYLSVSSGGRNLYFDLTGGRSATVEIFQGDIKCGETGKRRL